MTFQIPKINPDSYDWLALQDPNNMPFEHLLACAADYVRHMVASGIDADQFQDPASFVQPGDLQTLCNVVSWWPKIPNCPVRVPTMASLLTSIRQFDPSAPRRTFAQTLARDEQRAREWLAANGHDPNNPNETPKEKENRKAAARMRKMRAKLAEVDITDANEMALVRAVRAAKDNVSACRKYVREQETLAKDAYDAAVLAAKVARAATVSEAHKWVNPTAQALLDAEKALEDYRASN